ncbi:WD40 repeat domain-containing protein [Phormidesmis sp. 146-35]
MLDTENSVLWGIVIVSAFLLLSSSGLLIVTSSRPTWAVRTTGAIVGMGIILIAGLSILTPGITPSAAAGSLYLAAGILLVITTQALTSARSNQQKRNFMIWGVLIVAELVGLIILFHFSYLGPFTLLSLPFIPFLFASIIPDLICILRANAQSFLFLRSALILAPIVLFTLIVIFSGKTLNNGAINWSVQVIQLGFATTVAAIVCQYFQNIDCANQSAIEGNQRRGITFLLVTILVGGLIGIQGYSNFLKEEVAPGERFSSLKSPIYLQKILYTRLWIKTVAISPDAQFLAISGSSLERNEKDLIELWSLETGKFIQSFFGEFPVFAGDRSNGSVLIMDSGKNLVKVWSLRNRELQIETPQDKALLQSRKEGQIQAVSLPSFASQNGIFLASSTDNKVLVTGLTITNLSTKGLDKSLNNRILVWNRHSGKLICSLSSDNIHRSNAAAQFTIALSSDGQVMANIASPNGKSGRIYIWRLPKQ